MVEETIAAPLPRAFASGVDSFEQFYSADFRQVLGLAFVLTGNRQTAEEVAQEAFTAAYRRWNVIGSYDSPSAWVRRVACNHAASKIRRSVREARALLRFGAQIAEPVTLDESNEAFWAAVRRLPNRQAQAVALYYLEDLPVDEIAVILECSKGSVKTHLSRARHAMTKQLEEDDE